MAHFEYQAQCPDGSAIFGVLEAARHQAALDQLHALGLETIQLAESKPPRPHQPLGADDFIFFNEQLASMATAGLCLDQGLRELARDVESARLRRVLEATADDLQRGVPLEDAVAKRERELPILYSRVVRAGIKSGQLPATLLNLSQHLRTTRETHRVVSETLAYPITVLLLTLAVVSLVMLYVVPMFKGIFLDFDVRLPTATMLLIDFANVFPALLVLLGAVVAAGIVAWFVMRASPGGRRVRERILMAVPVLGAAVRASLIARFARSLALSVSSGVAFPEALRLSAGATGSITLDQDADTLATHVEQGHSPGEASDKLTLIPPMFSYVVEVAVARSNLPEALSQLAKAYDLRAARFRSLLRAWLMPASIVFIGAVVGLCIVALFLPLVQMINAMSS